MEINEINGGIPDKPQQNVVQPNQEQVPLSSIFDRNSDGGERITDSEYDKLSPENRTIVDGWIWSVHNYLGRNAELTKDNIVKVLDKEITDNTMFSEYTSNLQTLKNFAEEYNISQGKALYELTCKGIDINKCSQEKLNDALNKIAANLQETEPEPREK